MNEQIPLEEREYYKKDQEFFKTVNEAERIYIKDGYKTAGKFNIALAVLFIYLPLLVFTPFAILGALSVRAHLYFLGAKNIKPFKEFLPTKDSYRYNIQNQITAVQKYFPLVSSKLFWIFNCNYYCTYHIALLAYFVYLVRAVENWWCPFYHDKKRTYIKSPIDKSFWHAIEHENKLHADDRANPLWNKDWKASQDTQSKNQESKNQ